MVTRIYSSTYIRTALIPVAYLEIMAQKIPGPYGTFDPYIRSLHLEDPAQNPAGDFVPASSQWTCCGLAAASPTNIYMYVWENMYT